MKTITEAFIVLGRRLRQALALGLALFMLTAASMVPAAETVIYYHLDALGSPVAATNANGTVVWKEDYQPYGNRVEYQDGNTNSLWYTGKERDTAVGLDYFGARWYNPTLGRFNAIDPVDFDEANIHSFNRYAYANNNPYRYVDPDGRAPWDKNQRGINNPFGLDAGFGPGRGPGGKLDVGAGRINENKSFSQIKAAQDQAVTKRKGAPDFVVTKDGTAVPVSQTRMRQGFDDAGFSSKPSTKTSEPGVVHTVPTSKGPIDVRTMEGSAHHPRRAVTTTPGTNSPRTPSGGTPQGTKQQRRAASHFEQTP